MRVAFLLGLILATSVAGVEAQKPVREQFLPMSKRPLTGAVDFAANFKNCKIMTTLRSTCEHYLAAFKVADHDAGLKTVADLASYTSRLVQASCPTGKAILGAAVMPSRRLGIMTREYESDEQCLINPSTGKIVLSLKCGNVVFISPPSGREFITPESAILFAPSPPSIGVSRTDTLRIFTVERVKEKRHGWSIWKKAGVAVGVAGVVCLVTECWGTNHITQIVDLGDGGTKNPGTTGGPVNPPNIRALIAQPQGMRIGFSFTP